ncbi:Arylalkylamine N-acetyltransferase [Ceraceosorus bombacis]|uniref:Arylalkylamine N-acetyltransferase n=1 Tax=Ceraceosorus bombacis TaxID=401625 RepID=A0A0P1BRU0_9BASI|nr:Arylalkylamine N-acetyltransferase [Ceraceosorus bombacis]
MNPLTFFPPPSRSLSRQGAPPLRNSTATGSSSLSNSTSALGGSASNGIGSSFTTAGGSSSSGHHSRHSRTPSSRSRPASSSSARRQRPHSAIDSSGSQSNSTTPPSGPSDSEATASQASGSRSQSRRPSTSAAGASATSSFDTKGASRNMSARAKVPSPRGGLSRTMSTSSTEGGSLSAGALSDAGGAGSTSAGSDASRNGKSANPEQGSPRTKDAAAAKGRPPGMFFDWVRPTEIAQAYRMEKEGFGEDAASLDKLKYRQKNASHLFLGAFLPTPPPKIAGPLSISATPPRQLVAYTCGTAAAALTLRSMSVHSTDEDAWLVCLHSVCVLPSFRGRGLAKLIIEELVKRLQRAELQIGDAKSRGPQRGYECVALLAHEELIPFYEKCAFKLLGVSHVQWGSGSWFEMRRYLFPKDGSKPKAIAEEAEETASAGDGSVAAAAATAEGDKKQAASTSLATSTSGSSSESNARKSPPRTPPANKGTSIVTDVKGIVDSPGAASVLGETTFSAAQAASPNAADASATTPSSAQSPPSSQGGKTGLPQGMTQEQLVAALRSQTLSPSTSGPRNPGMAYSSVLGQALAAKTAVEDAFHALEARLVNRERNTNIAELYCPREECGCKLIKKNVAEWEIAEMGPLSSANLSLPNSPAPPSAPQPPPPPQSALSRIRSAVPSFGEQSGLGVTRTPVRGFWTLVSPLSFENIGFSKDAAWVVPDLPTSPNPSSGGMSPIDEEGSGKSARKPLAKRKNSLFWNTTEKKRLAQEEKEKGGSSDLTVKVKYLLCAECDCGPLGYTVLPVGMQDGGFAKSVGEQIKPDAQPSAQPAEPPIFLIAADRVRYRFLKN